MAGLVFNIFGNNVSGSSALHGLENQARRTGGAIGNTFRTVAKGIVASFATFGAISFFKGAIDEATEAQKVGAQTTAVLKSTGNAAHVTAGQIGNLANAISLKAGIDDEAIQSGENLLLTFTSIRNEVGKGNDIFNQATQTITDMSVALGQDMKSSTIQVGKALNDPIKGITALQRVGVSFTKQQKEQIKTLAETGHTMQAQKLILAELNKEFGGAAAAQATPAEKAKVAWKNLQEQIGTQLLPVIAKLANFFTAHVIPALSAAAHWIQQNQSWLVPLAAAIAGIVLVLKAWAIAQAAINLLLMTNPIVLIISAIVALGVALVVAYKKSETFRNIVKAVFNAIGAAAMWLWHNVFEPVWRGIQAAWNGISSAARVAWGVLSTVFNAIQTAIHAVESVFKKVGSAIATAWGAVSKAVNAVWTVITDVFGKIRDALNKIKEFISNIVGKIAGLWGGLTAGLTSVKNAIVSAFNSIKNAINGAIGSLLHWNAIRVQGKPIAGGVLSGALGAIQDPPNYRREGHAQGAGFFKGGPTWVNEKGWEAITLPTGARITPHSASVSQAGGSSSTMNVNVTVSGGLATEVEVQRAVVSALEHAVGSNGMKLNIQKGIR